MGLFSRHRRQKRLRSFEEINNESVAEDFGDVEKTVCSDPYMQQNKDIREKKDISYTKKIEKEAKEKLDKLLRLKPKEYKNISKKKKMK